MIEFHTPVLADRSWVTDRLSASAYRGNEYSFNTIFLWARAYRQEIADVDGFFTVRAAGPLGFSYLWPAGSGDLSGVLDQLEADAAEQKVPFRLIGLTKESIGVLNGLRPGEFVFAEDRNASDYLYTVDQLADLAGRKLHSKRNHCKRFQENHPDWTYSELTPADFPECLELEAEWSRLSREREGIAGSETIDEEAGAIRLAMDHFDELGLMGGVLRTGGRVVAFTIGDRYCRELVDVHFEKALGEIQGAFAMINREFARNVREKYPEILYLNREEDMGLESLRKAKSSYYPALMVDKFTAVRMDAAGEP